MKHSKVYIVGAGPGNPELLTVKAHKLIQLADVILHDELVSTEVLELSKGLLINVGKRSLDGKDQQKRQDAIVQLMQNYVRQGKIVVRLKGGDPMVFGRGVEEILDLNRLGIEWEMVPAVTAGIAAASYAGIPLTERFFSSGIMIVAATTADNRSLYYNSMATWVNIGNSLLIYMGVDRMKQLLCELVNCGVAETIPICAVSNVSMENQSSLFGNVKGFKTLSDDAIEKPAVFILGNNVRKLTLHNT